MENTFISVRNVQNPTNLLVRLTAQVETELYFKKKKKKTVFLTFVSGYLMSFIGISLKFKLVAKFHFRQLYHAWSLNASPPILNRHTAYV